MNPIGFIFIGLEIYIHIYGVRDSTSKVFGFLTLNLNPKNLHAGFVHRLRDHTFNFWVAELVLMNQPTDDPPSRLVACSLDSKKGTN